MPTKKTDNRLTDKNTVRTHDSFYAKEALDDPPKDAFVQIADLINDFKLSLKGEISISDLGCAAGTFPGYLKTRFKSDNITGYDLLEDLLDVAKINYPDVQFIQASVLDQDSLEEDSCDVLTTLGVLQIFDDPEPYIKNLIKWTKPNGRIFIHGLFNPYEVDVYLRYNESENYLDKNIETGWNVISQKTISNILKKNKVRDFTFHDFNISVDLEKRPKDNLRSWTEKYQNNERFITNGLCLIQPQYILEIRP